MSEWGGKYCTRCGLHSDWQILPCLYSKDYRHNFEPRRRPAKPADTPDEVFERRLAEIKRSLKFWWYVKTAAIVWLALLTAWIIWRDF